MAAGSIDAKRDSRTKIRIQASLCQKCGLCVEICPEGLFRRKNENSVPRVVGQGRCITCGHCVSVCSGKAIQHDDFPDDAWLKPGEKY